MANYTQNITNSVRCFGEGPSTKWGQSNGYPYTMTWGTSVWGEDNSLPVLFTKIISNSEAVTSSQQFQVRHLVDLGSVLPSSTVTPYMYFNTTVVLGSVSPTFESTSQNLRQGSWYFVFTSDTTAAMDRDFASWTTAGASDATFSCQAAGGTTWSEV